MSFPVPSILKHGLFGDQDSIRGLGRVVLEVAFGGELISKVNYYFGASLVFKDGLLEIHFKAGVDGMLEVLDEEILGQAFIMEAGAYYGDGAEIFEGGDSAFVLPKEKVIGQKFKGCIHLIVGAANEG